MDALDARAGETMDAHGAAGSLRADVLLFFPPPSPFEPPGTWANAVALATHGIGHFGEARKRVGARVSGVLLVCMSLGH